MKIAIISFTKAGAALCAGLVEGFQKQGEECDGYVRPRFWRKEQPWIHAAEETVGEWTRRRFGETDALIYIGAAGIAVRAIAPCLNDKMTDPAVLVCDEQGKFVIALLSGHVGGANALTERTAKLLGAAPVITTASDVQGLTAVDVWAKERNLVLSDRTLAKQVAAALVDGEAVGFHSDTPLGIPAPDGYKNGMLCRENVWVTCKKSIRVKDGEKLPSDVEVLRLIPKILTVGIGCRKNIAFENIETALRQTFDRHNLDLLAIRQIASIDRKKEEPGICRMAETLGVPFQTFSAGQLETVTGELSESSFVRSVTGTGSVCERAALAAAGEGARLLVKKEIYNGVTVAAALELAKTGAE